MNNRLLKRTLAQAAASADWSTQFLASAVARVMPDEEARFVTRKTLRTAAAQYTLQDLISGLSSVPSFHVQRYWNKQLAAAGITRLEFDKMAKSTVTVEVLKSVSRRKLLTLSAKLIPTLKSDIAVERAGYQLGYGYEMTVAQAIASNGCPHKFSTVAVTKTALLFTELGFTEKDCSFIRVARSDVHRAKLRREAQRYTKLAHAMR